METVSSTQNIKPNHPKLSKGPIIIIVHSTVLKVKSLFLTVLPTYVNHFAPSNLALWLDCAGISLHVGQANISLWKWVALTINWLRGLEGLGARLGIQDIPLKQVNRTGKEEREGKGTNQVPLNSESLQLQLLSRSMGI